MKKLLSIFLIVIVIVNLFLMVSCDKTDAESDAQSKDKTSDTSNDTNSNSETVAVNALNGMTPSQLYKNFIEDYTKADSFDISIITNVTSDGTQINSSVNLKLTNHAMYIMVDADDSKMECWFFEDSSYLNADGEKYKMANITADDIFGQGFIELTLSSIVYDIDNSIYLKKLENAQLYLHNDEYYCDLEFTASEASDIGMEAEEFSKTLFFNEQGKIKKIVNQSSTEKTTVLLDGYGNTVLVHEPADRES